MKKLLVIGSTVADIVINTPKIPVRTQDINITSQKFNLGGCAFNVASAIKYLGAPYLLFSPIGRGLYGDFVRGALENEGINRAALESEDMNGSCFCLVEPDGERTFLCEHGTEYKFRREWFQGLNPEDYGGAYICGLEIEEKEAEVIIEFLETAGIPVYFAPGPRINSIEKEKMDRIFDLKPILHINRKESLEFTGRSTIEEAAKLLTERTENQVIITDGEKGCYSFMPGSDAVYVPGEKVQVVDTIGAGDYHIGAYMAGICKGLEVVEALEGANKCAALVVQHEGAKIK